jgi:glutamate synthase (NADPH/NADH) large chain
MGSETGVQDFKPEEIAFKGRLLPGKLLLVDLEEGRIIPDAEVKRDVYTRKPYSEWVGRQVITLAQEIDAPAVHEGGKDAGKGTGKTGEAGKYGEAIFGDPQIKTENSVLFMERAFGYTREDRDSLLLPMIMTGQEPTSSMGTDTPLAIFSDRAQRVYAYFKQVFAQVTNPPIDSIREDLVMTLTSFVGPQENLLEETESHCRRIKVLNPIMTPADLETLKELKPSVFKSKTLDATFKAEGGPGALAEALDRLVEEAVTAASSPVNNGGSVSLIVLSDREALSPESGKVPVPALLAAGAVHHGLIRRGLRMKASIISETAEPREIMHFALLFGYGADLIVPYGALASIAAICRGADSKRVGDFAHAKKFYLKGLAKAMLKVMSKMGTSTLRSYRGAQIFEAIGLGPEVIDKCFRGTLSRIGGAGFPDRKSTRLNSSH